MIQTKTIILFIRQKANKAIVSMYRIKKTTILSGKNGSGKSTIIDAIFWLLTDETLVYGCQNSDNLDKNDRKLPVNVCGYFIKDNGESLKLRRKLTPKFNKAGEFSKYDTELEINDAEYSVKQYLIVFVFWSISINSFPSR